MGEHERLRARLVGTDVEGGGAVATATARAQRVQQVGAERSIVEGVVVAALGRQLAAAVAVGAGPTEAVDGRADDRPAARSQQGGHLVGQGGLAGRVHPVDGDPDGVGLLACGDQGCQPRQQRQPGGRGPASRVHRNRVADLLAGAADGARPRDGVALTRMSSACLTHTNGWQR